MSDRRRGGRGCHAGDEAQHPVHYVQQHCGLRTERYTLAHFYPVNEWELFNLEKDPQQLRSVYEDPAYAGTVAELKAELSRLRAVCRDTAEILPGKTTRKPQE